MAQNYIQPGEVVDYIVPSGGVTSGTLVLAGSLVGVALGDGAEDDIVSLGIKGVFEVTKVTGNAWVFGQAIYHNGTASATGVVGSNKLAGYAAAIAASGDTSGKVILK
jgi:predicted RecA/RadA family phage recombinase